MQDAKSAETCGNKSLKTLVRKHYRVCGFPFEVSAKFLHHSGQKAKLKAIQTGVSGSPQGLRRQAMEFRTRQGEALKNTVDCQFRSLASHTLGEGRKQRQT